MFSNNPVKGISLFILFSLACLVFSGCSKSGGNNGLWLLLLGGKKAPGISSVTPAADTAGIAVTTTVQVRFTKNMDAGTITNATFTLVDELGTPVTGTVTMSGRVATFTPASPLGNLAQYTATLSTGIMDRKGLPLTADFSWSFTTVTAGQVPAPEFSIQPDTYDSAQTVALSCDDTAAEIYYTINGDDPNGGTRLHYEGTPVNVDHNMTVRAMAERAGYDDSENAGGDYHIQAPSPGFLPETGEHNHDIDVTLSVTGGATIYYTTGSGDPDTLYTGDAIPVHGDGASATVRAWAVKDGLDNSAIVEGSYNVNLSMAAAPTFDPAGGTFDGTQTVTLHTNTDGATIRYTLDGSDPTDTDNTNIHDVVHEGTVEIAENTTINAYAFMTGMKPSGTTTDSYLVRVAAPGASETTGTHDHDLEIHLTAVAGASIYYTLGAGDPDILYNDAAPILISGDDASATIRAKAVKASMEESGVVSFSYEVQYGTAETPVFDPDGDTYTTTQNVTITSTAGSTIRYTTDGSDPKRTGCDTCTDAPSPASVEVSDTMTVRAYAYMTMMLDSAEAQENYLIAPTLTAMSPIRGMNTGSLSVTLTGTNFKTGADVRLKRSGQSDIVATNVVVTGPTEITADLDITGALYGYWDVVVTNTDTGTATLSQGFRVSSTTAQRVYGQDDFTSGGVNVGLYHPYSVAVDSTGIYVVDQPNNRVLFYPGTSTTPSRVYGQGGSFATNTANKGGITANSLSNPSCVAVISGGVFIADAGNNRVLFYSGTSTTAARVYGQSGSYITNTANKGGIGPYSLNNPVSVAATSSVVFIADAGNNRVLYYSGSSTTATGVYGQGGSFVTNVQNYNGISPYGLNYPSGIAVAPGGTGVYIVDDGNHRVLYYSGTNTVASGVYGQNGNFTTNTPNLGGISPNTLNYPSSVAVDSSGVYIADAGNHRVLYYPGTSITAARVYGQLSSFTSNTANNGGISTNSLNSPTGVAIDSVGIYIADCNNNRILYYPLASISAVRVYGQGGSFTTDTMNNGGINSRCLNTPIAVEDDSGGVYIADYFNHRVLYYPGTSTTPTRVYGQLNSFTTDTVNNGGISANSLNYPSGIAFDSAGVYIADAVNHRVLYYEGTSTTATRVYGQLNSFTSNTMNNGGISANSLYTPARVVVDSNGVYIIDYQNNRVLYYEGTSTTATRVYGQLNSFTTGTSNNGGISADSLSSPFDVAVVSGGIYIADGNNNRVLYYEGTSTTATRVYGQSGSFTTNTANNGGISADSLSYPLSIAVGVGEVYIADAKNNRVLYYVGTSTTASLVYGQGGSFTTLTINNGGMSANSLYYPMGVKVDSSGLYIADTKNNRVLWY